MASDADRVRKALVKRGYRVEKPTKRGAAYWRVFRDDRLVAKFPVSPRPGKWEANLMAGLARFERGAQPPRSDRLQMGRA